MPLLPRCRIFRFGACLLLLPASCKKATDSASLIADQAAAPRDPIRDEITAYLVATRQAYNNRLFDELERNADAARTSKAQFGNGMWRIGAFYDALDCNSDEPERMWQLHDTIHRAWIAAKPASITARVAYMGYLTAYAWHARGNDYANTVAAEGWRLFGERLKAARQVLEDSRDMLPKCPVWWSMGMRIALGQQWPRADYDAFYAEAKAQDSAYWPYDVTRSRYLSVKWYGEPGEWEEAADVAAADPKGAGMEVYARCVLEQYANYRNVFQQTRATWAKAQQGFVLMEQRYPNSLEVTREHCVVACLGGDRKTAKQLFDLLGANVWSPIWGTREYLKATRAWAENGQ